MAAAILGLFAGQKERIAENVEIIESLSQLQLSKSYKQQFKIFETITDRIGSFF